MLKIRHYDFYLANQALNLACEKIDELFPTCPSGELDFLSNICTKDITCAECWKRYLVEEVVKQAEEKINKELGEGEE